MRVLRLERLAINGDGAGVRAIRAAENFHQRALARAILADERVDFAGLHGEGDIFQRARGSESLLHAGHLETGRHFKYSSNGGFTSFAISGSVMFSFVMRNTPVSIFAGTFLPWR